MAGLVGVLRQLGDLAESVSFSRFLLAWAWPVFVCCVKC
jgi:hypothetical protein